MTRKKFITHYTAFVEFALKLAKVARESGVETLGHVVEDLEETEKVFKEGLRIILTEPENGAIANEILTNMTTHERDKYKRLYMTIQKRAVLGIQAGEGPYILHKVLMSLVNLTPKETMKINNVLFFSDDAEPPNGGVQSIPIGKRPEGTYDAEPPGEKTNNDSDHAAQAMKGE